MLFKINIDEKSASVTPPVTLSSLQLRERYDLQEWVIRNPAILGEDLLVITSEYDGFDRTSERLDVLALDQRGKLVIVELKRSAAGTTADLQALRYAAYCSTMSVTDVAEEMARHRTNRGEALTRVEAHEHILSFVDDPDFSDLDDQPRIILAAEDFSPEITATVLWLRSCGVDVSCVRLRPYLISSELIVDSTVLIPLPEAREYQIRRDIKDAKQGGNSRGDVLTADEFLARVSSHVRPLVEDLRNWILSHDDVEEGVFKTLLSYRRRSNREWITWIQSTKYEARAGVAPEVKIDPPLIVKTSQSGWITARARDDQELEEVRRAISELLEPKKEAFG